MSTATTGPLRAVLDAFESGAVTPDEVARTTALPRDVVDAVVAHLVRIGRLAAPGPAVGCPPSGCGGCAWSCRPTDPYARSSRRTGP